MLFVQFFCVLLSPLLNLFCFYELLTISVLYWAHPCMKYSLVSPIFLKRSLVFPILLFSSFFFFFKQVFLSLLTSLWNSAFSWVYFPFLPCFSFLFFPQLFLNLPQTTFLPFCNSISLEWFWSLPLVQWYKPLSMVLQVLCLPDLIPSIYSSFPLYSLFFFPLYNLKGFDLGHTWMA